MNLRRDVFQAIADPTRRAILTLLALQALTAGAIADNFKSHGQQFQNTCKYLPNVNCLNKNKTAGKFTITSIAKKMKEVADFIEPFRKMWDDRFNKLETIMKKYKSKK